jgi:hypothetical protein
MKQAKPFLDLDRTLDYEPRPGSRYVRARKWCADVIEGIDREGWLMAIAAAILFFFGILALFTGGGIKNPGIELIVVAVVLAFKFYDSYIRQEPL